MILNYIINNQLYIDKATYITIVLGQITIYGILLTFYQFVVSFQDLSSSVTHYLDVNLTEYFIKKKVSIFDKVISRKIFLIIFILEVLYKPMLNIYGDLILGKYLSIMNFIWYLFVIFYFIIFIVLFWQCTQSILMLKRVSNIKESKLLIHDINKKFIRKSRKEKKTISAIKLLNDDIEYLLELIEKDNDNSLRLHKEYNDLIFQIFKTYIHNKEEEINEVIKNNKFIQNQEAWIYNTENECDLLNKILNTKYFVNDNEIKRIVCKLHLDLVKLLIKRARFEDYEHINKRFYEYEVYSKEDNLLDCNFWRRLTIKIFKSSNIETREKLIDDLYMGYKSNENMYKEYCECCIFEIISTDVYEIFAEEKSQIEFSQVFSKLIKEKEINDYYATIIRDNLILYNHFDAEGMIKLLNEKNCIYVFSYMIIYYSIYKFRFNWEYINTKVIRVLWKNHGNMKEDTEKAIKSFKQSNIEHRFSENMYYELIEYIRKPLNALLLDDIYENSKINIFYIIIIKLCVLNQSYNGHANDTCPNIQIYFINELSNHNELMLQNEVEKMVFDMQYNYFIELEHIPDKLNISLRSLLLTNIKITSKMLSKETQYIYYNCIGEYLLIKSLEIEDENVIKDLIRKAFIARNTSINEYIDFLYKECHSCGYDLSYVQKEKMKEYLINII